MSVLEDRWQAVSSSDRYKTLDPDDQEKVRQNFYRHFVVSSSAYQSMPEEKRYAMREDFERRTQPPSRPGLFERLKTQVPGAVEASGAGAASGLQEATTEIGKAAEAPTKMMPSPESFVKATPKIALGAQLGAEALRESPMGKARQSVSDIPIPGAKQLTTGLHQTGETISGKIAPTEDEIRTSRLNKPGDLTIFQKARIYGAGLAYMPWELTSQAIPETVGSLTNYLVIDKAFELAGQTFMGKPISEMFKPKAPPIIENSDFQKSILRAVFEQKGRDMTAGPPRPFEQIVKAEEEAKLQKWLEDAEMKAAAEGKPSPSLEEKPGDLHPNPKVNQSMLQDHAKGVRDEVQKRLDALKAEPEHLETLKWSEDALAGYYRDKMGKIVIMGPPGNLEPTLQIEGPEQPLQIEAPRAPKARPEEPIPRRAPTPPPETVPPREQPLTLQTLKPYLSQQLRERHPTENKQTLDALNAVIQKTVRDQVGQSEILKQVVDQLLEQGMSDHLLAEEIARVGFKPGRPGDVPSGLTREETSRLKTQGISKEDVLKEADRLKQEWDLRNVEPEGHAYIRQMGGLAPSPDVQEEYTRYVKPSLRGSRPLDEAAQEMYEQGYIQGPSSADLLSYLREHETTTGKQRSVRSFIGDAIHNLEAPLTPPMDFSLESVKAKSSQPIGEPEDITKQSAFDLGMQIGDHFLKGEKGAIGPGAPIDPIESARVQEAINELVRRARAIGYDTAEDIMLYVARNAPKEYLDFFRGQIKTKTVTPWDTHAYKETEAAQKGNPIAQKSLKDRAWYEYLQDKWSQRKSSRAASRPLARFKDSDEMVMRIKFLYFKNDVLRDSKISKLEREAMEFYIDGEVPKLDKLQAFRPKDADKLIQLGEHPTPAMKQAASEIRPYYDEWYRLYNEHYDDVAHVKDYVPRHWKRPDDFVSWQRASTGGKAPWLNHRKLTTSAQGINAGFEPESLDIRDTMTADSDLRTNLLSKLHTLKKVALTMNDDMNPSLVIDDTQPKLPGSIGSPKRQISPVAMDAPQGYLRSDHPLLRGMAFDPKFKPLMDYMFTSRSSAKFLGVPMNLIESINAFSKRSIFLYSMFHPWALSEMLFAGSSFRDLMIFNKDRNVLYKTLAGITRAATEDLAEPLTWKRPIQSAKNFYTSFMEGHAALSNRPLALDSAEHSLRFSAIDDVQRDVFNRALQNMEGWLNTYKVTKPGAAGLKILRGSNEIFDKALWDYWSPMIKMSLYESHLADNMKVFGDKIPVDEIKNQTALYINKALGGLAWGDLLASPQTQQALQWLMLAPEWTIGRVLMGTSALTSGPQGHQARKLLARGFLAWFVFGNMMNYINTKKYGLKGYGSPTDKFIQRNLIEDWNKNPGRFMWQNDPGHETDVLYGKTPDGRDIYVTPSKAFTELYQDIFYPLKTGRGKASPLLNMAAGAITGYTAGGFPVTGPADLAGRMLLPMSTRGGNLYATLPKHKGMSAYEAEQLFEKYERTGNEDVYDKAMFFAEENGLNWQGLHAHARAVVKGEQNKKEARDEARGLLQ